MQNKTHSFSPELVMAYLDGELTAAEGLPVAAHLENCPDCADLAASFRRLSGTLSAWPAPNLDDVDGEMPEAVNAALLSREISQTRAPEPAASSQATWLSFDRWLKIPWTVGRVSALGAALAVLALAVFIGNQPPRMARVASMQLQRTMKYVETGDTPTYPAATAQAVRQESRVSFEPASQARQQPTAPLLARTSAIRIRVVSLAQARQQVEDTVRSRGGYVGQMTANSPDRGEAEVDASLRVPATELDATLGQLRSLGRVESESINADDVTRESVDLDARMANTQVTEERLIHLLQQQSAKLSDVLAVEGEITRVRGELERMASERKSLTGRISFAAISLSLREESPASKEDRVALGRQIGGAFSTGWTLLEDTLLSIVLFLLRAGPTVLFLAALVAIGVWIFRYLTRPGKLSLKFGGTAADNLSEKH